jgi:hypothetical protein
MKAKTIELLIRGGLEVIHFLIEKVFSRKEKENKK